MRELTHREQQVCYLRGVKCLSNKEIARILGCSHRTVEVHTYRVYEKLGVKNWGELVRLMTATTLYRPVEPEPHEQQLPLFQ